MPGHQGRICNGLLVGNSRQQLEDVSIQAGMIAFEQALQVDRLSVLGSTSDATAP